MGANSRLSMLDEFGGRNQIIPAEVKGRFRTWRTIVHFVLLVIFLALPWFQINGTQALLFDIPGRRFEFFGLVFLSHDSPLLFFIFATLVLTIMLTTALWGRVWCGWACPQTVFIDAVFRRIEIIIEGNYRERRRLANSPITFEKALKASAKWLSFLIVSSVFSHSLIAYFTGSRRLIEMMNRTPQENWSYFLIVSGVTALLLFDFGWFREQFCIIVCPYGRFQSVLMDQHSLSVVYDQQRGEPRRRLEVASSAKHGDCVSCNRCVQVCPTGIDIRNGIQMECIGCTACIDACDEIMTKVNKPQGLISYNIATSGVRVKPVRARTLVYSVLLVLCFSGFAFSLVVRRPFSVAVLRGTDSPYQMSPEGLVINHFKINLHNQSHLSQFFKIELPLVAAGALGLKLAQSSERYELASGESREIHLFLTFPAEILKAGKVTLQLQVNESATGKNLLIDAVAVGPYSQKN